MQIAIFTLFPDFFQTPLKSSMLKRAQEQSHVSFTVIDIREYATTKHSITDDRPFGGGPGMVMMIEPIDLALTAWKNTLPPGSVTKVIVTSAQGKTFTQDLARDYAALDAVAIICGHYEGIDERVVKHLADDEVCIGEFVLTGGEPAAIVIADAVTRLVPGVLGNEKSNQDESHTTPGVLGYPQFTRPAEYKGWQVPPVLLEGNHAAIAQWRQNNRKQPAIKKLSQQ